MKRVLVTGGSGFIGLNISDYLLARGWKVTIYDKVKPCSPTDAELIIADLLDLQSINRAVREVDFVVHAAGLLGTHETVSSPINALNENVIGTVNLLEAATQHGVSVLCISKPNVWLNPYSISKDCMEKFCFMFAHEHGLGISILKLFNVYGSRQKYSNVQKAIPTWIVRATMDLIHVYDVCVGVELILSNFECCRIVTGQPIADDVYAAFTHLNKQILELGSGVEISVIDAVNELGSMIEGHHSIEYLPMRRGEVDDTRLCADVSRLNQLTGYRPSVSLREGFESTISFYRDNLKDILEGKLY